MPTYDQAQEAFRVALQTGEGVDEAIDALCAAQGPVFRAKLEERAADAARKRSAAAVRPAAARLADDLRAWGAGQSSGTAIAEAAELAAAARKVTTPEALADVQRRAGLLTGGAL